MNKQRLPDSWVNRIFHRLLGAYGSGFTLKFSKVDETGRDLGFMAAKDVWAEELGGFADNKDAIAYALDNLPEHCPNVIQFREICRRAPKKEPVALPHIQTPEEKRRNSEQLKKMMETLNARTARRY